MRAVGYIRVSTEEQAKEGVSLAAQRAQVEAWCVAKGWELVEVFADEGISGKSMKGRPGLAAALNLLEQDGGGVLVVTKLDRLSRSVRDILDLVELRFVKNGATLCSIGESLDATTASGKFVLLILAGLAQMEREQVGERTGAALQHKKAQGDWQGNVPYGWRAGNGPGGRKDRAQWVEVPEEQAVIRRVKRLRKQGMSLRQIVAKVNDAGGLQVTLPVVYRITGYHRR